MATYTKRKANNGAARYVAQVRVRPFQPTAKTFDKLKDAKAWAEAQERELKRLSKEVKAGGLAEDVADLTISGLVETFLNDPETRQLRYYDDLSLLLAWWVNHLGAEKVRTVGSLKLRKARDRLRHGRKPATVNRYLSALRSAWNWGIAAELIEKQWPRKLLLKEPTERQRYLTDEELTRLLGAAEAHSATMHAAILVSVGSGLRQGELLRLRWPDIDLKRQRVQILRTKTDSARSVYLPAAAVAGLKALRIVGAKHVFVTETGEPMDASRLRTRWLQVRAAAGLQDFRWHDLRHSCASFLAQQGASLLEIGSVLGHRSASVTKRYSHLVEGAPVTGHDALDEKLKG